MRSDFAKRISTLESKTTSEDQQRELELNRQLAQAARESDRYYELSVESAYLMQGSDPGAPKRLAEIDAEMHPAMLAECESRGLVEAAEHLRQSTQN
jgi:hypothetical protein